MKPISRVVGFFSLAALAFVMTYAEEPTAACICIVGATIFDAIKTINRVTL